MKKIVLFFIFAALFIFAKDARGHEWYTDLKTKEGKSCCNNGDCKAVPYRRADDRWEVQIAEDGKWHRVPEDSILDILSPDADAHACYVAWYSSEQKKMEVLIRCFILPGSV